MSRTKFLIVETELTSRISPRVESAIPNEVADEALVLRVGKPRVAHGSKFFGQLGMGALRSVWFISVNLDLLVLAYPF